MDSQTAAPVKVLMAYDPEQPLNLLEQFSTSAEGIAKFAHKVITEVEEGRADALRVAILMKTLEKIYERVNDKLGPYYRTAAEKFGEKPFPYHGAEVVVADTGTRYDYTECNHPGWNDLKKTADETKAQMDDYETLLKALKSPTDLIIEGEGVTVNPPTKKAKAGIKITIK
jgi:hypothetical protein